MSTAPDADPCVLAVETSSRLGSIALGRGDRLLTERAFTQQRRHAVELLPTLDAAMGELGWTPADLRHVYVSAGPGSFTGLRIAITFARTLAQAVGVRIALVPTVEVLARNAPDDVRNLGIVLDAKRQQIYTAAFSRPGPDAPFEQVVETCVRDPADLLAAAPRPLHLLGEGIDYHRERLPFDGESLIEVDSAHWPPRAEAVFRIGRQMADAGQFTAPADAIPIYLRRPEAEEKWEQLHGPGA